jgi:hypothetical protein
MLLSLKFEENCAGCDEKDGDIVRIILRYICLAKWVSMVLEKLQTMVASLELSTHKNYFVYRYFENRKQYVLSQSLIVLQILFEDLYIYQYGKFNCIWMFLFFTSDHLKEQFKERYAARSYLPVLDPEILLK